MSHPAPLKPTDKAIKDYHAALKTFAAHKATNEGATETAFSDLLAVTARPRGWTLIPKKGFKSKATGRHIAPDGTLEDDFNLPRGYWEAKDFRDDLDAEVKKKIARGYPLTNSIFEDIRRAALYQDGVPREVYDLTDRAAVAGLLTRFYDFAEPDIEGFHQAVGQFKEVVPDLARGLVAKIDEAHRQNPKFQAAFAKFFDLCRTTLNPNIRREAVDEMLVQHLLTERLFCTIFRESDFVRKNVIAVEMEAVAAALVSQSFSRDQFLKNLPRRRPRSKSRYQRLWGCDRRYGASFQGADAAAVQSRMPAVPCRSRNGSGRRGVSDAGQMVGRRRCGPGQAIGAIQPGLRACGRGVCRVCVERAERR